MENQNNEIKGKKLNKILALLIFIIILILSSVLIFFITLKINIIKYPENSKIFYSKKLNIKTDKLNSSLSITTDKDIYKNGGEDQRKKAEIESLILQLGDDKIDQNFKKEISIKLEAFGKEAIPYLIAALADERVYDPCAPNSLGLPAGHPDADACRIIRVGGECKNIILSIIYPKPDLNMKYPLFYKIDDWQTWWNENQDKSLNEMRKMVRDYFRAAEAETNFYDSGYRDEKYDYLDVLEMEHDDVMQKANIECLDFVRPEQCDYLEWPINYGCFIIDKDDCQTCLAIKNMDDEICDLIESDFYRDNCYWAVAINLNKAGMSEKINFCYKFINTDKTKGPYEEACLELIK